MIGGIVCITNKDCLQEFRAKGKIIPTGSYYTRLNNTKSGAIYKRYWLSLALVTPRTAIAITTLKQPDAHYCYISTYLRIKRTFLRPFLTISYISLFLIDTTTINFPQDNIMGEDKSMTGTEISRHLLNTVDPRNQHQTPLGHQ